MSSFHLDFETRSKADLKKVGAFRYAEDPSTEVLMASIRKDDGPSLLWVNPAFESESICSDPGAYELLEEGCLDPTALWYAWNAQFEQAISRCRLVLDMGLPAPQPHQWRCVAAMARRAALPGSLGACATLMGVVEKDKKGAALVRLFSLPDKKTGDFNDPRDPKHQAKFMEFGQYCLTDNDAETALHHKLKAFELTGQPLLTFQLDSTINDRGLPVNVKALRNAQAILEEVWAELGEQFHHLTGLMPTQKEAVKALLQSWGVDIDDMKGETLRAAILSAKTTFQQAQLDPTADWDEVSCLETHLKVLELYEALNYAAAKKVTAMLACVCSDGRVRGTLLYYGAGTGRWAGRLIQPQNFKRPTIKDTAKAYQMICDGCTREELELLFGNPLEVIASCIRHFIQWPDGEMLDADYSAIEARIVCWLAGQEDALEDFRNGIDVYKKMAGTIFNIEWTDIANPSYERTVGKHTVLGCGFGMWWPKFILTCAKFGVTVTESLAKKAVETFRALRSKVVELWYSCERAAMAAIAHPGKIYKAGPHLKFCVTTSEGVPYLVMRLPSGRNIVYPWPKLEHDPKFDKMGITFYGQIEGKAMWGRIKTYGAKLVENATQGIAADVAACGACEAERLGFHIFTLIHDQALAPRYEGQTAEGFCAALTTLPSWAKGLPIAAEGKVVPYYKK